jgi:hypothetical protein
MRVVMWDVACAKAKIAEIIEGIGAKGIELRRTRSAIRAAQEKVALPALCLHLAKALLIR